MTSDQMLEFAAPFDLESCRQRLDNRHERPKIFAWDWQRRTYVHTQQTAPDTVEFTLKRLEKNEWVSWGSLAVVHGVMRELGTGQTVVIAQTQIVYLWIFAPLVVFVLGLVAVVLGASSDPEPDPETLGLMLALLLIGGIGGPLVAWWWARAQLQHLIGTLKEALGQWD